MPTEKTHAEWMHAFASEAIEKLERVAMNSQDHDVPPSAVAEVRHMAARLWELFPPSGQRCSAFRCPACDERHGRRPVYPPAVDGRRAPHEPHRKPESR